jgi:DNA-binding NarL/FixJ family response regulator
MNAGTRRPARILLVDDNPFVRLGVGHMLANQPDLSISCETDTIEGALAAARSAAVDLAIVDLSLGTADGLEVVRQLLTIDAGLPVLVFSMHDEALFAELAFKAGARGYLMKQEGAERLLPTIRELLAGRTYRSPPLSRNRRNRPTEAPPAAPDH